jgi:hypothetical protein
MKDDANLQSVVDSCQIETSADEFEVYHLLCSIIYLLLKSGLTFVSCYGYSHTSSHYGLYPSKCLSHFHFPPECARLLHALMLTGKNAIVFSSILMNLILHTPFSPIGSI